MARSFPPDVIVLDSDALIHVRMARGKKDPQIVQAKSYRLAADTFVPAVVTPQLTNEASLAETLRRLRLESGRWDRVSLLLPDSWFRINILDLPNFPESSREAEDIVRWSLKRTMPIDSVLLRVRHELLSRTAGQSKVLAISAMDQTLSAIENVFEAAGIAVVLIEPDRPQHLERHHGARAHHDARPDLLLHPRTDFTTAAFRGSQPLFIRSRNLNGERTLGAGDQTLRQLPSRHASHGLDRAVLSLRQRRRQHRLGDRR